ncbi:hypothetical protein [Streptomyces nodosus]|uniref:hypothetical protein n=1 Tax=Streptomyces nodosus TaxID=40318 RepID=UPI00380F64BD
MTDEGFSVDPTEPSIARVYDCLLGGKVVDGPWSAGGERELTVWEHLIVAGPARKVG